MTGIDKLLNIASASFDEQTVNLSEKSITVFGDLAFQIESILNKKNGFYAFESGLHFFSAEHFYKWNESSLWKKNYSNLANDIVCFAEDVFGNQFCIKEEKISFFEAETAQTEYMANSVEEWANILLADYNFYTGYQLAHDWQIKNGKLPIGERLLPKVPFVLGGEYNVSNLYSLDAVKGMNLRGELAVQIHSLPEGAPIKFHIVE